MPHEETATGPVMEPLMAITSKPYILAVDNVDTDQIIPARFLTTTSRDGLGIHAFHDWRYDAQGTEKTDEPLNQDWVKARAILVAGPNFGCGSSREHAPWALLDYGFKAVISTEIADIFRNNALKNGLLAIVVSPEEHTRLTANPEADLTVDLESQTIRLASGDAIPFTVDPFARRCLLSGVDQLGFLLSHADAITAYEERAA